MLAKERFLGIGTHLVKIVLLSKTTYGFNVRFENSSGFYDECYHDFRDIVGLFITCDIEFPNYDYIKENIKLLSGRELYIHINALFPWVNDYSIEEGCGVEFHKNLAGATVTFPDDTALFKYKIDSADNFGEDVNEQYADLKLFEVNPFDSPALTYDYARYRMNPGLYDNDDEFYVYLMSGCTTMEDWNFHIECELEYEKERKDETYFTMMEIQTNALESKYNGAYGLNDDAIDNAFDGNPEAYWNVD